jgi:2-C-methyl-D-erythritol 4-phosphate cytidylyltransferase
MNSLSQRCWAVLPAAGIGSRLASALPKQYLQVAGQSILEHSLAALLACRRIEAVAVALHPDDTRARALPLLGDSRVKCTLGGAQRSDSVLAGLLELARYAKPEDWVLVHDAARPCLRPVNIEELMDRVIATGIGGILAEPVVDTIKQATAEDMVARTVDRNGMWRAQTPQMFRLVELQRALQSALEQGLAVTDEASAMEMAGHRVQLVPGSPSNLKVTVPADLDLAGFYLGRTYSEGNH